ncbi:hypothetical protein L596_020187 [Steinernema carpocapsae]|uniref:Replication protein A subunit n=1 Tax=Steinernema carpocapsae TaxID=34508 RepID=A0A4V6A0T9_STECR|nr:hypothetical protein L596_020183 [Steinernema carpocapsae]TKR72785.1 hypothetical protein L596_020187 [Steinernema carpocapsae]
MNTLQIETGFLKKPLPSFVMAQRPAARLQGGFINAIKRGETPRTPVLLAVVAMKEIDNDSFRLRVYDGETKASTFSTARILFQQFSAKAGDVPFVIRVDTYRNTPCRNDQGKEVFLTFISKAAILTCRAPPEAYEIALEQSQSQTQRIAPQPLPQPHEKPQDEMFRVPYLPTRCRPVTQKGSENEPPSVVQLAPSVSSRPVQQPSPTIANLSLRTPPRRKDSPTTPVGFLSPRTKGYILCGLVSNKTAVTPIPDTHNTGHNRIFSFVLTDKHLDDIKVSAYNELADYYHDMVQNGLMCYVRDRESSSSIRRTPSKYNNTKSDYHIVMNKRELVQPCTDQPLIKIPALRLNKTAIQSIRGMRADQAVDVLGIITAIDPVEKIVVQRTGRETVKRVVKLLDSANTSIHVLLWGSEATSFPEDSLHQVLAIQNCVVKEFRGNFSLQVLGSTKMEFNPDSNDAALLQNWFRQRPEDSEECISEAHDYAAEVFTRDLRCIGTMANVPVATLAEDPRGVYFNIVGYAEEIRRNSMFYVACPTCQKKGTETEPGSGVYRCDKCNFQGEGFTRTTMISVKIADWSGSHWISMFSDYANHFLNIDTADELVDNEAAERIVDEVLFRTRVFRVRAKIDSYNGVDSVSWNAYDVYDVPYEVYKTVLTETLAKIGCAI